MKKLSSVFLVLLAVILLFSSCEKNDLIAIPFSSDSIENNQYNEIMSKLMSAGFHNIDAIPKEDLNLENLSKSGYVESIYIDGNSTFSLHDKYVKDAPITIYYHSPQKISVPISSSEAKNKTASELEQLFSTAGFNNIEISEQYTLDPDITDTEFEVKLSINGISSFSVSDKFEMDDKISIVVYKPYEKYTVQMHINFIGNLIFNKYDIILSIDGSEKETLKHGQDKDFEFRLKKGNHTISFTSADDSSIEESVSIQVSNDIDVSYEISCSSDYISLETEYLDNKIELAENQAKTPQSASEYKYENYVDVINSLTSAGFDNIKEEVLYDIIWGITPEGEVKSVSIAGDTNFTRGEIFDKNAEVIVTYHMLQADDPDKLVENETTISPELIEETTTEYETPAITAQPENTTFTTQSTTAETTKPHTTSKTIEDTTYRSTTKRTTKETTYRSTTERTTEETTRRTTERTTVETTARIPTSETMVWIPTKGGKKYHTHSRCSNMDGPSYVTISEAISLGFTPCKRCH